MKKSLVFGIFVLVLLIGAVHAESTANVKIGEDNYNIGLSFLDANQISLTVNGENSGKIDIQSSQPYTTTKIDGLEIVVKDITFQAVVGGTQETTIWVAGELVLDQSSTEELTFEEKTGSIILSFIETNRINLVVNGENSGDINGIQSEPYYITNYYQGNKNLDGIDIIVKDITYQAVVGGTQETTLLIGSEVVLNPSNTEVNCSSDDDCMIEGDGVPYCEGNKRCQWSMGYECINKGTEESYCNYPEILDCITCENGCADKACNVENEPEMDMNSCLDKQSKYWDQKTDKCYDYDASLMKKLCDDPDGGKKPYTFAHTFGFRSYSSADDPSRDLRIRTGGSDGCLNDTTLREHYCSNEGHINSYDLECEFGCANGKCQGTEEEIEIGEKPIKLPKDDETNKVLMFVMVVS